MHPWQVPGAQRCRRGLRFHRTRILFGFVPFALLLVGNLALILYYHPARGARKSVEPPKSFATV
jgi:hypothetical protein